MDMTDGIPAAAVPGSTLVIILALKVLLSPEENDYVLLTTFNGNDSNFHKWLS